MTDVAVGAQSQRMIRRSKREPFYIGIGLGVLLGSLALPVVLWTAGHRVGAVALTLWAAIAVAIAFPAARKDARRAATLLHNPEAGRRSPAASRQADQHPVAVTQPVVSVSAQSPSGSNEARNLDTDDYADQQWWPKAS